MSTENLLQAAENFVDYMKPILEKLHRFYDIHGNVSGFWGYKKRGHYAPSIKSSPPQTTGDTGHIYVPIEASCKGTTTDIRIFPDHKIVNAQPKPQGNVLFCTAPQINPQHLDDDFAKSFGNNYAKSVFAALATTMSYRRLYCDANQDKLEHMSALLSAMMRDPELEPEQFFEGYVAPTQKEDYNALELEAPDHAAEQELLAAENAKLDNNPGAVDVQLYARDIAMRSGAAKTAISQWERDHHHSTPESFRLMSNLVKMIQNIKVEEGEESANTDMIVRHYRPIFQQIAALRRANPEDMKRCETFLRDSDTAMKNLRFFKDLTGQYKDAFKDRMNDLQNSGHFTGDSLKLKHHFLQETALTAAQAHAGLGQITQPLYLGIDTGLSQIALNLDKIEEQVNSALRSQLLSRLQRDANPADFNMAALGIKISSAEIQRFKEMDDAARTQRIARSHDALTQTVSQWNDLITDTDNAFLMLENGETPAPLMLTYDENASEQGAVRLLPKPETPKAPALTAVG